MDLTKPLEVADLRAAFPRDTIAMEGGELGALLDVEEHALRADFGISSTGEAVDEVLARAMIAAWPVFLQQVRNVSQESVGSSISVTYAQASSVSFEWPGFVATILGEFSDADSSAAGPATTKLVR